MTRARLALTVAALAAVTVALAGCEKPNPGASVFSGTTTQYRQAACWAAKLGLQDSTAASELMQPLLMQLSAFWCRPQVFGATVTVCFTDSMTTSSQGNGFFIVHCHASKGNAHIVSGF